MTAEELKKQLEEQRRGICPPLGNRLQEAARIPFSAGDFAPGCFLSASVIEEARSGDVVIIRTRDGRNVAGEYFPCASVPARPVRKRRRMGRAGEFPEEPPGPAIELRLLEDRRRRERFALAEVLQVLKVVYVIVPEQVQTSEN